tara:strand:- start:519 stop:2858 length:2340 start_codon:yes stop_codon:yes gene_type:complete
MASYLKASIQRSYAESFLADLERNDNQYFFFIGKGTAWTAEPEPNTYTDSVGSEYQAMNDIIGYKKLNPQNIIFALPRYEWTSGTVYDQYNDTDALFDDTNPKIFYVVTDENNIYKCLSNNSGATTSTVKPSGVLTSSFGLSDGYVWQYIATVKEGDLPYELTDYIPVDFATSSTDTETANQYNTQISAVNSSITRIDLVNSSGASAGVYTHAITQNLTDETVGYTLNVTVFDPVTNKISIGGSDSVARINSIGSPSTFIGYVMRVDSSQQNATEINNYAIITGASAVSDTLFEFTLQNDVVDFTITPTAKGNFASVEIIPYIKIVGNGSGAYAFPTINDSRQISAVTVVSSGRDYSAALVEVASPKSAVTNHPTLTAVLSPKGGHGSNILKELNTKDILIVVKITEDDAAKIVGGGSYRQFGIIKNPVLGDGSGIVAGREDLYYRDISLIRVSGAGSLNADFTLGEANIIIGTETYSSAKVVGVKSENDPQITLKTLNASGRFITKQDRINDYVLTLTADPSVDFQVGETVEQIIPAATVLDSGISYGFDLTTQGRVLDASGSVLGVRVISSGNFIPNSSVPIVGLLSGVTGTISSVAPSYGESVWITDTIDNTATFLSINNSQKLYKVVETGQAYFDLDNTPAYRGVHVVELGTSLNSAVGVMDTTSASLTQNSFSSGDLVTQGVTGTYGNYATGQVYHWEFINNSYGKLYLTNVVGSFKSVAVDGLSGSTLGAYIVTNVDLPEIDRTSGEILYIDNVRPIQRTIGQQEEFRLRLGF